MAPQKKLALVLAAAGVLVVGGLFLALRDGADEQDAVDGGVTPPGPSVSSSPSTAPSASAVPTTISADLTAPSRDIDHSVAKKPAALAAPTLAYDYTLATTLPTVRVKSVPVDMYTAIDEPYARRLANAYGMPDQQPFIRGMEYSFIGARSADILRVNARSGYSTYETITVGPPASAVRSSAEAVRTARAFLQKTAQLPPRLDAPITYERRSLPGIFFVEYHRSWDPLPILETNGMLTADVRNRAQNRPADADIVRTSDRTDGQVRPSDFNTITVAVDGDGHVLSAVTRMRPIDKTLPARALKAPQAAWDELVAGKGVLGFTLPAESNVSQSTWSKVFPDGVATSKDAQVREIILSYVEKPEGVRQAYLQPVYIFKGRAKLATGPMADFVVAVPALADDALPN